MSAETVLVRGPGGWVFEMDIPTADPQLERYQAALAKGELRIVDPSTVEKVTTGTEKYGLETRWVDKDPSAPKAKQADPAPEAAEEPKKAR